MSNKGPRTLILYCHSQSLIVHCSIFKFFDTPALLIRISIWKRPVLGCEKWFFALLTIWAGPLGDPTSAWIMRHWMPCSSVKSSESLALAVADESEV